LHAAGDYADEWQALYRVEDARRRLKRAKAEAEAYRLAVFAWDVAATRSAVAEAQRVTAQQAARQAEAEAREARQVAQARLFAEQSAERRRQEAAEREEWLDQTVAFAKSAVTPRTVWMAWAWGQGQLQRQIAERCHTTTAVVSVECRRYLTVFASELLYRSSWGRIELCCDRQVKLAELLKGKPEPPRPESWRASPPEVLGLPPGLTPPPDPRQWQGLSELERHRARRKLDYWVRSQRVAGYTLAVLGQALGVGPERVRQMEQQAKLREARWNWGLWASRQPVVRGRPLDVGGPRDQWLSFELGDGKD
jgi:hypothetical protein